MGQISSSRRSASISWRRSAPIKSISGCTLERLFASRTVPLTVYPSLRSCSMQWMAKYPAAPVTSTPESVLIKNWHNTHKKWMVNDCRWDFASWSSKIVNLCLVYRYISSFTKLTFLFRGHFISFFNFYIQLPSKFFPYVVSNRNKVNHFKKNLHHNQKFFDCVKSVRHSAST